MVIVPLFFRVALSYSQIKFILPSAPWCLTAVFGMGTGVTTHDMCTTRQEVILQMFYKIVIFFIKWNKQFITVKSFELLVSIS